VTLLTYRQAARRVHRSVKTVKRWRRHGLPMGWDVQAGQKVRVVDEEVLLSWWRARLAADPVHQARLRAQLLREDEDHTWS
jgi:transposase